MTEQERKALKELSALFDEYIDNEVYKERPKRYDAFYVIMENVSDYEYTYVLAYELSERNEKVKKLFKRVKYYKENLEEYFDTLNLTDFYRDSINLGYGGFLDENNKSSENDLFFEIDDSNITLNDIKRFDFDLDVEHIGLWKLVSYLIDTKNLYVCKKQDFECASIDLKVQDFKPIEIDEAENRIHDIMQNPHKYVAYCKDKESGKQKLTALSKDMPLEILDKKFLQDLNIIRTAYTLPQAKINYSVPTLKFKNEKVVNIPVNLNLSKKELVAYISKIKDDFEADKSIVMSPLEIFGESIIDAKEPKNKKKNASKKDFADALYIYDLYRYFENLYEKKLKKDDDYTKLSLHVEVSLACGISDVHNQYLRSGKVEKSKNKKYLELRKSDKIEKVYKLMREYIEDEKYKELITGSEVIEIKGMWERIPNIPLYSITEDELNAKIFAYAKEKYDL